MYVSFQCIYLDANRRNNVSLKCVIHVTRKSRNTASSSKDVITQKKRYKANRCIIRLSNGRSKDHKRPKGPIAHLSNYSKQKLRTILKVLNTKYLDNLLEYIFCFSKTFKFLQHILKLNIELHLLFQFL